MSWISASAMRSQCDGTIPATRLKWAISGRMELDRLSAWICTRIVTPPADIGLATPADAQAIALLSRDEIEHGLGWSWTAARVLRAIRDRNTNVVVVRDEGRVVGFALLQYDEDRAHLLLFAVAPSHRRRGIATSLWQWLEETLRVAGVGNVQVELRASNAVARSFYEKVGFELINATSKYYRGVETALHMIKELMPRNA